MKSYLSSQFVPTKLKDFTSIMPLSLRSEASPLDPSLVPGWVADTFVAQCVQVATISTVVYDAVITMDREVKYFWTAPWKLVKIVYFTNRYIAILGSIALLYWNAYDVNMAQCNFSSWMPDIANWMSVISIDYILSIRVLALYSQNETLSKYLKTLLALEAGWKMALAIYLTVLQKNVLVSLPGGTTTCASNAPFPWHLYVVDWVIPMAYGLLLLALAIHKASDHWRMSAGFKGFTLVKVVIQDQVIYFLLAVSCNIFAIISGRVEISNDFAAGILSALANPVSLSILGSRMLFNLKEAGERGLNGGTNYRISSGTISDMNFASQPAPRRGENVTEQLASAPQDEELGTEERASFTASRASQA